MKRLSGYLLSSLFTAVCAPAIASDFGSGLFLGTILTVIATKNAEEQKAEQATAAAKVVTVPMPIIRARYSSGGAIIPLVVRSQVQRPRSQEAACDTH